MSYNAAGVLSHMLSDGEDCWTIPLPRRQDVVHRIVQAIKRWPLDSKRNINYRYINYLLSYHVFIKYNIYLKYKSYYCITMTSH